MPSHRENHNLIKRVVRASRKPEHVKAASSSLVHVTFETLGVKERTRLAQTKMRQSQGVMSRGEIQYYMGICKRFFYHEALGFKAQALYALLCDEKLEQLDWATHKEEVLSWLQD